MNTAPDPDADASKPPQRFIDNYLGYLLGQANYALYKNFAAAVREAGLRSLEWRVLATLSDQPGLPVGQLAHEVLSQQPTVTKLVQRMAAQGWVSLQNDPGDQRRTLVIITPVGQEKASALIKQATRHEAHILRGLSAADIVKLKRQLRLLAQSD
jgi:DNA-binding MarR family transcriptional regulator